MREFAFAAIMIVFMTLLSATESLGANGVPVDFGGGDQKLPEVDPDPPGRSDYETALYLIRHQHYAKAVSRLEHALAIKPNDARILTSLGYAKVMLGDYDAAFYYTRRAIASDPGSTAAHQNLGGLYLAKGDIASAQKELATLATLCPSGCTERSTLTKAIADAASKATSEPPMTTATTSGAGSSSSRP